MGRAFTFADNLDTDAIVPGQYLSLSKPEDLGKVCMEGYRPGFIKDVKTGDVFVAGRNFGCGSSREHAPVSIKAAGVACVIAGSFARIFFRNAINIGLPALESPAAAQDIEDGDELRVYFAKGEIHNLTKNKIYPFSPLPETIMRIIQAGGLVAYVKEHKK